MANKFLKFKDIVESNLDSISKYNFKNDTKYYLFNPDNITSFKCKKGMKGENLAYLFEYIQVMFGNDEIYEYVILDDKLKENIDISKFSTISKNTYMDVEYQYTKVKGVFSRIHFNVILEIKNITYYLYIKTIDDSRFFKLMEGFISNPLND